MRLLCELNVVEPPAVEDPLPETSAPGYQADTDQGQGSTQPGTEAGGSAEDAQEDSPEFESDSAQEPVEGEVYPGSGTSSEAGSFPADAEKWRRWWMIPLWIGVGIVAIAGLFMLWAYQSAGFGFWFFCSGTFMAMGILVLVLAAQSRTARWLHLRIKQGPGQTPRNIAISLPIPLRLARWIMRLFGGFIPNMGGASASDILMALDALEQSATPENPVYIQVDEEGGEHVEIFIG
jgi:hypothetical protein